MFAIAVDLIFVCAGLAICLAPAEFLLKYDRRTGNWIFNRTLRKTNEQKIALRSARKFYKYFGLAFVIFGVIGLIVDLVK